MYDARTGTTIGTFRLDNISNTTTNFKVWQSESCDAGVTWSLPRPFTVVNLSPSDVKDGTHIAPGTGIQLSASHPVAPHRLLSVLILENHCKLDKVVYSDDGGKTWLLSSTPLPGFGEAQLAEVANGTIIFNGRNGASRGVAFSHDGGVTWQGLHTETKDASTGVSCMASLMSHPADDGRVLYSHPSGPGRFHGVVLSGNATSQDWHLVGKATPVGTHNKGGFAYSCLSRMTSSETVGLTYETDARACPVGSACKIVFQTMNLSIEQPLLV